MEINSERQEGGSRSEFDIQGIDNEWKATDCYFIFDACFDLEQRKTSGIVEPVYFVVLSHGDAPFLQLRVPITTVYKTNSRDYMVFQKPYRALKTTTADTINVKLVGANGRLIQNPGAWSILFVKSPSQQ